MASDRVKTSESPEAGREAAAHWAPAQSEASPPVAIVVPGPPPEPIPAGTDEDDGRPYALRDRIERRCRSCHGVIPHDALLCGACGVNQQTGEKPAREYEPFARSWEAGRPLAVRRKIYIQIQCVVTPLVILGIILNGSFFVFFAPWFFFTGMLAFLLGTFDRLDLTRNRKGKFALRRTWYICFFRRPTEQIILKHYEGVATGICDDRHFTDWVVTIFLLPFGVLPAILWLLYVVKQDTFFVALTKNMGYPELKLYQGWDQERTTEIARCINDITGLPYDENGVLR